MKKFLFPVLSVLLIILVGCAQQPNSARSINGLKLPSQNQAQGYKTNGNTAITPSSFSQDGSKAGTAADTQDNPSAPVPAPPDSSPGTAPNAEAQPSIDAAASKTETGAVQPSAPEDGSKNQAAAGNQNALPASQPKVQADAKVVQIKEKMFIQQCDDIYMNAADYKGKVIKLEGMYQEFQDPDAGKTYHIIYRRSPGCCGTDGQVGFVFDYEGNMPKPDEWIKAAGTVEVVKDSNGYDNIMLRLSELEVSAVRGEEFVTN